MQDKNQMTNNILSYLSKQTGMVYWEDFVRETGIAKDHWILKYLKQDLGYITYTTMDISITPRGMYFIS